MVYSPRPTIGAVKEMSEEGLHILLEERDRFSKAVDVLRKLQPALEMLKEDLWLENEMNFSQSCVVDFSELYRFMHPEYVKARRENLLLTNLLFLQQPLLRTELYLIPPYYSELITHIKNVSTSLSKPIYDNLLGRSEVKEFMEIMEQEELGPGDISRLDELYDFLQANLYVDLLDEKARELVLKRPIDALLDLFEEGKLKRWVEPHLEFSELVDSHVFHEAKKLLSGFLQRKQIPNRIDALAAAFVHEANKILIDEKRYLVLVTGSPIPLLVYKAIPFTYKYLDFPIQRDLYYVSSRIYLFKKYKEAKRILEILNHSLPHIRRILNAASSTREYLGHAERIERIPDSLVHKLFGFSESWSVVKELLDDMAEISKQTELDRSIPSRSRPQSTEYRVSLFRETYEKLKDALKLKEEVKDTLLTIEDVLTDLELKIGRLSLKDRATFMGIDYGTIVEQSLMKLLNVCGFDLEECDLSDITYIPRKPDIIVRRSSDIRLVDIVTGYSQEDPLLGGSALLASSKIIETLPMFKDCNVKPVLIVVGTKMSNGVAIFSHKIGLVIVAIDESTLEKVSTTTDEKKLKAIASDVLCEAL